MSEPKPAMVIDGEPWWRFHFEYDFDGKTYAFDVLARSEREAHERMRKIALARYMGQGTIIGLTNPSVSGYNCLQNWKEICHVGTLCAPFSR